MEQVDKKAERQLRKQQIREQNEPPKLSVLEEVGNAVTHGVGAGLAVVGLILMLIKAETGLAYLATFFYGLSLIFLMLMSCLYHAFRSGSSVKRLWRRFDYDSIYLLIGGTFAPLYLIYWGNVLGIVLFCVQWGIIAAGITLLSVLGPGRLRPLHFAMYFIIGWSGLMFLPDFFTNCRPLFYLILGGGIIYTVGMVPFARDKAGDHFIWHFFVLAGAIIHWFAIYLYVY